jgi:hypothetical protein
VYSVSPSLERRTKAFFVIAIRRREVEVVHPSVYCICHSAVNLILRHPTGHYAPEAYHGDHQFCIAKFAVFHM